MKRALGKAIVLMKAFDNAGSELSLSICDKAKIAGVTSFDYRQNLTSGYSPDSNESLKMLYFIQIYRELFQFSSGDKALMRHWYLTKNKALNGAASQLCQSIEGLVKILEYFDTLKKHSKSTIITLD